MYFLNLLPIFHPLEKLHGAPIKWKEMPIPAKDTNTESQTQRHLKAREREKTNTQATKIHLAIKINVLYENTMLGCFQERQG